MGSGTTVLVVVVVVGATVVMVVLGATATEEIVVVDGDGPGFSTVGGDGAWVAESEVAGKGAGRSSSRT